MKFMFDYIEHKNKAGNDHIGFECSVDGDAAMSWLAKNRPRFHMATAKAIAGV